MLIPGTELSVKEGKNGIHVLIAFSNDWICSGKDNINTFLDSVFIGISNRENENTRCKEDLTGVIQLLDDFNLDYFINPPSHSLNNPELLSTWAKIIK